MEMESRWYLSPGQKLEDTKIEDRGLALHVTKKAWGKVTAHLDRNRLIQEAIEKEQAHKQALKKGSEEMTKNWDNSVENIRKRKEEERLAHLTKSKEDKMQKFLELRKEQEAIRQKYIEDARKAMYISGGYPKALTSALIQSEVIYERQKQVELEKAIQEHEREEEVRYAQKVKEGAEQEKLENLEKEKKILVKKLEIKEYYLNDMHNKEELNKLLKETRISEERLDIINAENEMKSMKQFLIEEDKEKRAKAKQEFNDFYKKQQEVKKQLELEDKEQDLVIEIYSKAKHRIDCLRKKKEKDIQKALEARRDAASKKLVSDAQAKSKEEERILKKAIEERDREEEEKLLAKAAFRIKLIQERDEDRKTFIKREEQRKFEETERLKWEMLNRFKKNDITKKYEEDKQQKLWQETLEYRKELFVQMAEKDERRRKIKKENDMLYECSQEKLAGEDKKFLEYAEECSNYAKNKGRTTAPIERVVLEYKKENNLPLTIIKPCENYEPKNRNDSNESGSGKLESPQSDSTCSACKCKCFKK